jgi:hypothetical protein
MIDNLIYQVFCGISLLEIREITISHFQAIRVGLHPDIQVVSSLGNMEGNFQGIRAGTSQVSLVDNSRDMVADRQVEPQQHPHLHSHRNNRNIKRLQ